MGRTAQTIRKHDWNTDGCPCCLASTQIGVHFFSFLFFFFSNERTLCALSVLFSETKSVCLWECIKGETGLEKKPWIDHCFSKAEVCYSRENGPLRQLSSFTSPLLLCKNAPIVGKYIIQSHPLCLCYEFISEKRYSNMLFLKSFRIESPTVTHDCNSIKASNSFWASNLLEGEKDQLSFRCKNVNI